MPQLAGTAQSKAIHVLSVFHCKMGDFRWTDCINLLINEAFIGDLIAFINDRLHELVTYCMRLLINGIDR